MDKSARSMAWRVRGSYFEGCNCEAICPCRAVGGRPGGSSSFGECFGTLSWHVHDGHADDIDLSGLRTVLSLRYFDRVQPSTPWDVVLYVDDRADEAQRAVLADIFLGRAGGTVAQLYGPVVGEVLAVRSARITLEHTAPRKRIDVVGYLTVESEGEASIPGDVQVRDPRVRPSGHRAARRGAPILGPGAAVGGARSAQRLVLHRLRLPVGRRLVNGATVSATNPQAPLEASR